MKQYFSLQKYIAPFLLAGAVTSVQAEEISVTVDLGKCPVAPNLFRCLDSTLSERPKGLYLGDLSKIIDICTSRRLDIIGNFAELRNRGAVIAISAQKRTPEEILLLQEDEKRKRVICFGTGAIASAATGVFLPVCVLSTAVEEADRVNTGDAIARDSWDAKIPERNELEKALLVTKEVWKSLWHSFSFFTDSPAPALGHVWLLDTCNVRFASSVPPIGIAPVEEKGIEKKE